MRVHRRIAQRQVAQRRRRGYVRAKTLDPFSDLQLERYARHLVLPEIGGAGQRRLLAARIAVIGAGGIGAGALPWAAAAGVGRIRVIDDDVVDRSNLQRQTLFGAGDIGAPKAERAARALARVNPDCGIEPIALRLDADNAAALLRGADLVIDGSDNFSTRFAVADATLSARIPLVSAAVGAFDGQLATFRGWEPDQPCYRCLAGSDPAQPGRSCADEGVLGALPGALGALAAAEAVRLICGYDGGFAGKLLLMSLRDGASRTVTLAKDPACPACGGGAAQPMRSPA